MSNNKKVLLAAVMLFACSTALIVWLEPQPSSVTWQLRWWSSGVAFIAIAVLVWAMRRHDLAPDFLRQLGMPAFEMKGLCFSIVPEQIDDRWRMNVFFQNRHDRRCHGHVVIRAGRGFWLSRPDTRSFVFPIECDGAEFGRVFTEIGIPVAMQGQKQSFDVAAKIDYPNGRGRMVRFRDGLVVGRAGGDALRVGITLAAAATGSIHITKPAQMKFILPRGVRDVVDTECTFTKESIWLPGERSQKHDQSDTRQISA